MIATDAALALVWGLVAGSALIIGSAVGLYVQLSRRVVAGIMAFGSGILISVIAFNLMDEAFARGGLLPSAGGFLAGATLFTVASVIVSRSGARHRKRSRRASEEAAATAITIGTIMDDIPEAIIIGVSLIDGKGVALVAVIAIFVSNIPEALSSSVGLKSAGRKPAHIFLLWTTIMCLSGVLSLFGYLSFADVPREVVAVIQTAAAGALLAMIADTMIPEAFAETHDAAGLITALGFLAGFALSHGLA